MKHISTATASPVHSHVYNFTSHRRMRTNNPFLVLLLGLTVLLTSFRPESFRGGPAKHNLLSTSVPFKGKATMDQSTGIMRGELTHIGRFTTTGEDNYDNFPLITGTATITAANGDQLFVSHSGFAQVIGNGIMSIELTATITGGTGRFAGATGSYQTHGVLNANLGTATATFDGTISY